MFFSDASVRAIAAVAYLHVISEEGACHTGFVLGKAKLAPQAAHTIPRLELGAAVLAAELAETIMDELDFSLDAVEFYTDSRVVLGYINNQTRRFYVYVATECSVSGRCQAQHSGIISLRSITLQTTPLVLCQQIC